MAIDKNNLHAVGNLNSSDVRTIPYVFAGEDLENYSVVELSYVDGKRVAKYASASADKVYLAPAVEVFYDDEGNQHFYIGKDEGTRIVHFDPIRFETSNYAEISGTAPARGQFASWDATAKKYQLSATVPATPVGGLVLEVVELVGDEYGFGRPMIRFEVK